MDQPMTISIPEPLESVVRQKAASREIGVDDYVREAVEWFLRMDSELLDELDAWQEIRDEGVSAAEDSPL